MRSILAALLMAGFSAAALAGAPAPGLTAGSEPPPADLRVERAADTVILTDGTKITGTIIAAGLRAVLIIEKDQTAERTIKRSEIESFAYGVGSGEVKGYATGVRPEEGLPVIVGEGSGAVSAAPATKPSPAPAAKPAPKKDLSKLWELLGGNSTPDQIRDAIAANPQWQDEIRKILGGNVPPEGAEAVNKFRNRLKREPGLRKTPLDGGGRQGKLHGGNAEDAPKGR